VYVFLQLRLLQQVEWFETEWALLEGFAAAVRALDPDILVGFELQKGSLGYLIDRAATMEMQLLRAISRLPEVSSISLTRKRPHLCESHRVGCKKKGSAQILLPLLPPCTL
jgi:DNA polymerase elongation subunit (family B)